MSPRDLGTKADWYFRIKCQRQKSKVIQLYTLTWFIQEISGALILAWAACPSSYSRLVTFLRPSSTSASPRGSPPQGIHLTIDLLWQFREKTIQLCSPHLSTLLNLYLCIVHTSSLNPWVFLTPYHIHCCFVFPSRMITVLLEPIPSCWVF